RRRSAARARTHAPRGRPPRPAYAPSVPSKTAALHCRAEEAQRVAGGSCGRSRRHQAFERAVEMVGDDVVHGEYNVDTSLYTGLGNNIDGRRLQLDQIHIRLYAREIFAQARAIR